MSWPRAPGPKEDAPETLLEDLSVMTPMDGDGCLMIGNHERGHLIYTRKKDFRAPVTPGKYIVYTIDKRNGTITLVKKSLPLNDTFTNPDASENQVIWLKRQR